MKSLALSHKGLLVVGSLVLTFVACGSSGGGGPHDGGGGSSGSSSSGGSGGHGGTAGMGGSSGSGGAKGMGGAAGSAGAAGSGGTAGAGGMSGSGGSAGSGGDSGGGTKFAPGTICNKSGTPLTAPATVDHVIVFMFENEDFASVIGNKSAPYINSIATDCGYASNYLDNCFSTNLVSSPHYLALTSGSNCNTGLGSSGSGCITDDSDATAHTLSTDSIFSQASSWKAYQEDMPSNCALTSSGNYATKHNPAAYYSSLSSCGTNDIPIAAVTCGTSAMTACGTPSNQFTTDLTGGTLPAFSFVTPNLVNDMHNGLFASQQVAHGDNWLYTYLPLVLASTDYLNGKIAVFVLWDEQSSTKSGGTTPNFFVSPYITAGTVSSTQVNHFASLRAFESMLGITTQLGCASGTEPGTSTACPTGSVADLRSAIGF